MAEMATPTVKNQELPVAGEKDSLLLTLVTSSLLFGMAASFFKKKN
ncbi:LPXTG cell wall anchor domain-containing protein [Streptococcus iniae]